MVVENYRTFSIYYAAYAYFRNNKCNIHPERNKNLRISTVSGWHKFRKDRLRFVGTHTFYIFSVFSEYNSDAGWFSGMLSEKEKGKKNKSRWENVTKSF